MRRAVSRIFEVLVDAGVVEWINPETVSTSFDSYPRGGIVRLTALGRYVLPDDLLDGPAAGHAALYLLARGLADGAEVSGLIDIGVFVDVLAASLDEPEELYEMFSAALHSAD